jgi:ankyrin repeat protein
MHYAAINGYYDLVKVLVSNLHASVEPRNLDGDRCIHLAAMEGEGNLFLNGVCIL